MEDQNKQIINERKDRKKGEKIPLYKINTVVFLLVHYMIKTRQLPALELYQLEYIQILCGNEGDFNSFGLK